MPEDCADRLLSSIHFWSG